MKSYFDNLYILAEIVSRNLFISSFKAWFVALLKTSFRSFEQLKEIGGTRNRL